MKRMILFAYQQGEPDRWQRDELDDVNYEIARCEALRHYAELEGDTRRI
jgi:hypothetical protein